MKALVKAHAERGIWMQEIETPAIGHNDVLIKVNRTAICGTDIHIYQWNDWAKNTIPVPIAIGHEFCGEIVECGSEVMGFNVGDRVSAEGHITCGVCRNCRAGRRHLCMNTVGVGVSRHGAFAELVSVPAFNAFKVPDTITDDMAAILDPLGNATHTALSFDLVGEDVLITGAGPIGIMAVAIARYAGARHIVITDINDYRLNLAREMGASRALNVTQESLDQTMTDLGMEEGFDVGMEMSGNPEAFRDMLRTMHHGGKVALLGIPTGETSIDWNEIIFKGLVLKGIYGREMFETWYKMSSMLQSGLNIDPVITHHFDADRSGEDVLITGAGPIGIMAVTIARYAGARHIVITDINDYRLNLAREMGASRALNVTQESLDQTMTDLGMEEGFDVGMEMSGNPEAFRDMLRTMHHGGKVALLGIPTGETSIDWNEIIFKGLVLKGIYGREMFETWYKMSSMLQSGLNIDPVITHHFDADEFQPAFDLVESGQSGKVILHWSE